MTIINNRNQQLKEAVDLFVRIGNLSKYLICEVLVLLQKLYGLYL